MLETCGHVAPRPLCHCRCCLNVASLLAASPRHRHLTTHQPDCPVSGLAPLPLRTLPLRRRHISAWQHHRPSRTHTAPLTASPRTPRHLSSGPSWLHLLTWPISVVPLCRPTLLSCARRCCTRLPTCCAWGLATIGSFSGELVFFYM